MEYDFVLDPQHGVKHPAADACSRITTKETDDFDINNDICIIIISTSAQIRFSKVYYTSPEATPTEPSRPQVSTIVKLLSAQGTNANCGNIRPTVGIPGQSFNID